MSKNPLAIVCALAFAVGGASAFVLEFAPRGAASVRDFAGRSADDGRGAADSEAAEARPAEGARPVQIAASDEGDDSATLTDGVSVEPTNADTIDAGKLSSGKRVRSSAEGRAADGLRVSRSDARVSKGQPSPAGGGLAGRTVGGVKKTGGGVKKTGAVLGRAFGRVGGVFHD